MEKKSKYILICAPSGSGLSEATKKLIDSFGSDVAHEDLETTLCESAEAAAALRARGIECAPSMYHITWYLSRSEVTQLWIKSAELLLHRLSNAPQKIKILTCHLTYYSGRRTDFYSPIRSSLLTRLSFEPSHVVLLIDDVYDMYHRLTSDNTLFSPKALLPRRFARIKDDEMPADTELSVESNTEICTQWKATTLTQLLLWRHFESLTAERLAREISNNYLVWGIKQQTASLRDWLLGQSRSVYLSHPISRPRRMFRKEGEWREVVHEFNGLQSELLSFGLTCVMPTAIDEYRLSGHNSAQKSDAIGPGLLRVPRLEARWRLPGSDESLLYCSDTSQSSSTNSEHSDLLRLQFWNKTTRKLQDIDHRPSELLIERTDVILRGLETQIQSQISSRDHLFVAITSGLIVFRPLYGSGRLSAGVEAEIRHWSVIAEAECKRIIFIHFDEDVRAFEEYLMDHVEVQAKRESQIRIALASLVGREHGVSDSIAARIISSIELDSPEEILDVGLTVPIEQNVRENLPEYRRTTEANWKAESLCFVGCWEHTFVRREDFVKTVVVNDLSELRQQYGEIASFLLGTNKTNAAFGA